MNDETSKSDPATCAAGEVSPFTVESSDAHSDGATLTDMPPTEIVEVCDNPITPLEADLPTEVDQADGDSTDVKAEEVVEVLPAETISYEAIMELKDELQKVQAAFDAKIRYDKSREAMIDRLHEEVQEYKADLVLKILKPLVNDLIHLHDDVGKLVEAHQTKAQESIGAQTMFQLFSDFQCDIEDILQRYGFDGFTLEQEQFDPKQQRAMQRIPTEDEAKDRQVAGRLRKGFRYGDRVIRPEMVNVYVHTPNDS